MLRRTFLIYFFGLFLLIWNTSVKGDGCIPEDVIITTTPCDPSDFDGGMSCTLQCNVTYDSSQYTVSDMCWTYFMNDSSTNIRLFDNMSNTSSTDTTLMNLELSTYYSGTYSCQIVLENIDDDDSSCDAMATFSIADFESASLLTEHCEVSSDCVTYNAFCDTANTQTCLCQSPYNYYYPQDAKEETIACLSDSSINGTCNLDEQCPSNNGFSCDDYVCGCDGTVAIVTEFDGDDNKTTKCLQKVKPNGECTYNEECTIFDSHTKCENGKCTCTGDYADHDLDDDGHCGEGLSDAAIAGIAVAGVFALGVVAIILRCIFEKCCCSGEKKEDEDVEKVEEKYN